MEGFWPGVCIKGYLAWGYLYRGSGVQSLSILRGAETPALKMLSVVCAFYINQRGTCQSFALHATVFIALF